MKSIVAVIGLALSIPIVVLARQDTTTTFPSRFLFTESADVLPNLSFNISGATSFFTDQPSSFYTVQGRIGLADAVEVAALVNEDAVDFFGRNVRLPEWQVKLKALSETDHLPCISIALRSAIAWDTESDYGVDLPKYRPQMAAQGVEGFSYSFRLTSVVLMATKHFFDRLDVTGGVGVVETQTKEVKVWWFNPPPIYYGYYYLSPVQKLTTATGFLQAQFRLNDQFELFAAAQTVPMMSIDTTAPGLTVQRGTIEVGGIRYTPVQWLAFDLAYTTHTKLLGLTDEEYKLGLSILLDFLPSSHGKGMKSE